MFFYIRVSSLLTSSIASHKPKKPKDEKKALVYIQYNNQSAEYNYTSGKYGDVRYFHTEEKALANELQLNLNQKYCPEKPEGCFVSHDLSENYPNLPKKQFEIWIDVNKIPEPFH
ncbi:MAG: hypothetical protein ACKN87_07540 [Microcystis aeruginosa]